MGVKTIITKKDLTPFIKVTSLKKTKEGARDSVYMVNKNLVLKVFENSSVKDLKEERKVLKLLHTLSVPQMLQSIISVKGKPACFYERCGGQSVAKVQKKHIIAVGEFLKEFHTLSKAKKIKKQKTFTKKHLLSLIKQTKSKLLQKMYNSLRVKLQDDGVIHGDIFKDNVLFKKGKISGVIDFAEVCNGDFHFDLAVVALDFCQSKKDVKVLLKSYGSKVAFTKFKNYIEYAGLYYATTRYLEKEIIKNYYKG